MDGLRRQLELSKAPRAIWSVADQTLLPLADALDRFVYDWRRMKEPPDPYYLRQLYRERRVDGSAVWLKANRSVDLGNELLETLKRVVSEYARLRFWATALAQGMIVRRPPKGELVSVHDPFQYAFLRLGSEMGIHGEDHIAGRHTRKVAEKFGDQIDVVQRLFLDTAAYCRHLASSLLPPDPEPDPPVDQAPAGPQDRRDAWIYAEAQKGTAWETIVLKLRKKPRTWPRIETVNGIKSAAQRYADRHGVPRPATRQHGRRRKSG